MNVIELMTAIVQNPTILFTNSRRGIKFTALERFNLLQMYPKQTEFESKASDPKIV